MDNIVIGLKQPINAVSCLSWDELVFWNRTYELSQEPIRRKLKALEAL